MRYSGVLYGAPEAVQNFVPSLLKAVWRMPPSLSRFDATTVAGFTVTSSSRTVVGVLEVSYAMIFVPTVGMRTSRSFIPAAVPRTLVALLVRSKRPSPLVVGNQTAPWASATEVPTGRPCG